MADTVIHLKIDKETKDAFDEVAVEQFERKPSDALRHIIKAATEDRLIITPKGE